MQRYKQWNDWQQTEGVLQLHRAVVFFEFTSLVLTMEFNLAIIASPTVKGCLDYSSASRCLNSDVIRVLSGSIYMILHKYIPPLSQLSRLVLMTKLRILS